MIILFETFVIRVGRAVQMNSTHNIPNDFLNCIERTLRSAQLFLPI